MSRQVTGKNPMKTEFTLNGKPITVEAPESLSLLRLLREQLGLTGTKCGCDSGDCGVCATLFDGKLVYSCLVNVSRLEGHQVTTIEGMQSPDGELSDLQEAFLRHGAVQCGYCIPSMILAGEALLRQKPYPTRSEIREGISSVLCRCTGYQQIIDAIEETAHQRQGKLKKQVERSMESAK
jgi:aerobic-type carbon monoxide dehydrogenase small subunit (CoxS/CutS family)